jgi:hypothetical protein
MTALLPVPLFSVAPQATARMQPSALGLSIGVFRLPTDPLFYADLVLQNIVSGSRYRVIKDDDGTELSTGVAGSTTVTLTGLPVYANPQLVKITVRKGTAAPKYQPFDTFAYMARGSVSAFIAQIPDPIA